MEEAIDNMIEEIKKPVDPEINGSARKAELQQGAYYRTTKTRANGKGFEI